MPWCRANASARARSRLAIATTAARDDALAPTMNDPAIFAAPRMPIRRLIAGEGTPAEARSEKSRARGFSSDRPDVPGDYIAIRRTCGHPVPHDERAPRAR